MIIKNLSFKTQNLIVLMLPVLLVSGSMILNSGLILMNLILFYQILFKKIDLSIFESKWIKLAFVFFLYQILSSVVNGSRIESVIRSISYLKFISLSISIFLVLNRNENYFKFFLINFIFVIFFVNIDSIYQYFFGVNFIGNLYTHNRLTSIFGNEQIVGSFLTKTSFLIIPLFSLLIKDLNKRELIIFFWLFLNCYTIFISGERMAFLINIFGILIYLIISLIKHKKKFFVFLSLFLFLLTTFYFTNLNLQKRYKEIFHDKYGLSKKLDIKNSVWGAHYLIAFEIFKNNKFFGVGPKNFRIESCKSIYENINSKRASQRCTTHPHNIIFEIISELGLFGLIIFLLKLFYIFKENHIKNTKVYTFGLLLFLYVWPIGTNGSIFTSWNGTFMWIYIGLMFFVKKKHDIIPRC